MSRRQRGLPVTNKGHIFQLRNLPDRLAKIAFFLSLAAAIYLAGLLSAKFSLYPYRLVNRTIREYSRWFENPDRLVPAVHEFAGARTHPPDRVAPGLTLITSYFPETDWIAGAQLIDADGTILHQWQVDNDALFPGKFVQQNYIHGAHLFDNGDLMFNLEFVGLARISACGDAVWTFDDIRTHHSIAPAEDGTFWVSGHRTHLRENEPDHFADNPFVQSPAGDDLMLNFSADGELLREISITEVFSRNNLGGLVLRGKKQSGDIYHMNDVEPLFSDMAAEYPEFEAGDLVVSLRDLHTVLVVDPDDLRVKWIQTGETSYQHDADFIGGGRIGVFDNNLDFTDRGTAMGGTRIMVFDTVAGTSELAFPQPGAEPIYTEWSGKWQLLDNGNLLITEARAGRAIEVTPNGETVWEWVNARFDESRTAEVMEASRYDLSPDQVAAWTCD